MAVAGACAALSFASSAQAAGVVPGQFIAKMYTEVLGRAPDPSGWSNALPYFQGHTCNQNILALWGESVFTSAEFTQIAYDHPAQVLVMYRAILNREPDAAGFASATSQLDSGAMTTVSLATSFFNSSEFAQLVPQICTGNSYSFDTQGATPAMRLPTDPTAGGYDNLTEAQLQSILNGSPANTVVFLRQKSIVQITTPLMIPNGVTLATYGYPNTKHHAYMARLVRTAPFAGPIVWVSHAASTDSGGLKNLWIDGQRLASSTYVPAAINVEIGGGKGVKIDSNFLSGSLGWSTIHSYGRLDNRSCASNEILNNVISAYPATHFVKDQYTDGLSIGCENSSVTGNAVVDATDVGIVVFAANPVAQKSVVTGNTVVSAGNSAFAGMGFDGYTVPNGVPVSDFTGSSISSNTLWSSPQTHFIFGLTIGSRPWFNGNGMMGQFGVANNNTSAGIATNVGAAISVSGMNNPTVLGNTISAVNIPAGWTACSIGNIVVDPANSNFSPSVPGTGSVQQPYTFAPEVSCISDTQRSKD